MYRDNSLEQLNAKNFEKLTFCVAEYRTLFILYTNVKRNLKTRTAYLFELPLQPTSAVQ